MPEKRIPAPSRKELQQTFFTHILQNASESSLFHLIKTTGQFSSVNFKGWSSGSAVEHIQKHHFIPCVKYGPPAAIILWFPNWQLLEPCSHFEEKSHWESEVGITVLFAWAFNEV